jgi:hypothetical protein
MMQTTYKLVATTTQIALRAAKAPHLSMPSASAHHRAAFRSTRSVTGCRSHLKGFLEIHVHFNSFLRS